MGQDRTLDLGDSVKPTFFKTTAHLMICTGPQCQAKGSSVLFQAVWHSLEREKLMYYAAGGHLRLTESGCLGACQFGPTVACYFKHQDHLREAWYAGMDYPRTINLARALDAKLELPAAGRYDE
jgi:(2Fe-2S) ferredoxin